MERSAAALPLARSHTASRRGVATLASQQIGACGAGNAGSTKGMQPPGDGARGAAPDAREPLPALEAAHVPRTAPAQAVVALIVRISPQELPRQIAGTQCQRIIVCADIRRPGGTNIVSQTRHGTTANISYTVNVYCARRAFATARFAKQISPIAECAEAWRLFPGHA